MKKVIFITVVYSVCVLWFVFGATTTVNTVSPSYASNIVRRVLAENPFLVSNSVQIGVSTSAGVPRLKIASKSPADTLLLGDLTSVYNSLEVFQYDNSIYMVFGDGSGTNNELRIGYKDLTYTNGLFARFRENGTFFIQSIVFTNLVLRDGTSLAMPLTNGSAGQVLKANGSNALFWAAP